MRKSERDSKARRVFDRERDHVRMREINAREKARAREHSRAREIAYVCERERQITCGCE